MPTRNINLTTHLDDFVDSSIAAGRYQNASEVIRDGLRLLEDRQREDALKLDRLRTAVRAGLDDLAAGRYHDVSAADLDDWFDALEIPASK